MFSSALKNYTLKLGFSKNENDLINLDPSTHYEAVENYKVYLQSFTPRNFSNTSYSKLVYNPETYKYFNHDLKYLNFEQYIEHYLKFKNNNSLIKDDDCIDYLKINKCFLKAKRSFVFSTFTKFLFIN